MPVINNVNLAKSKAEKAAKFVSALIHVKISNVLLPKNASFKT